MILLVILFYIVLGALEVFSLIKKNKKKELILYSVIFTWAFILSMLLNLGFKIPSPTKPIENFVEMAKSIFIQK